MDLREKFKEETKGLVLDASIGSEDRAYINWLEQQIQGNQIDKIIKAPKPFTVEFEKFLLVNALRNLTTAQRHILTVELIERDSLREYKTKEPNGKQ